MTLDPNSVNGLLVASKQFLRTREGFHTAPSVRGFARHIEANMQLYETFSCGHTKSRLAGVAFALWRLMLLGISGTVILFNRAKRIWWLN